MLLVGGATKLQCRARVHRYKVHTHTARQAGCELAQPGPLSQPHVYSSLPIDDALSGPRVSAVPGPVCQILHSSQFSSLFLSVEQDILFFSRGDNMQAHPLQGRRRC